MSTSLARDDNGTDGHVVVLPVPVAAVLSRCIIRLVIPMFVLASPAREDHFDIVLAGEVVVWLTSVPVGVAQLVTEVVNKCSLLGRIINAEPDVTVTAGTDEVEVPGVHSLAGWDWKVEEVGISGAKSTGLISSVKVIIDLGVDDAEVRVMPFVAGGEWVAGGALWWRVWVNWNFASASGVVELLRQDSIPLVHAIDDVLVVSLTATLGNVALGPFAVASGDLLDTLARVGAVVAENIVFSSALTGWTTVGELVLVIVATSLLTTLEVSGHTVGIGLEFTNPVVLSGHKFEPLVQDLLAEELQFLETLERVAGWDLLVLVGGGNSG